MNCSESDGLGYKYPPIALRRQSSSNTSRISPSNSSASLNSTEHGANNFATLRTTSILTRQVKEHDKENQNEQISGYKRMRRQHQKALFQLEVKCKQEIEDHKQKLDKEYDALLQQFSKELEKLQTNHYQELDKKVSRCLDIFFILIHPLFHLLLSSPLSLPLAFYFVSTPFLLHY